MTRQRALERLAELQTIKILSGGNSPIELEEFDTLMQGIERDEYDDDKAWLESQGQGGLEI